MDSRSPDEDYARFFSKHSDRVLRFCTRVLGDRGEAEDAVQEVFLRAWKFVERFDLSRDVVPWLHSIALHHCRDRLRSKTGRKRRVGISLDDLSTEPTADPPELGPSEAGGEAHQAVHEALRGLPPRYGSVIWLHDFQNLTHEEIASLAGISPSAARKRYSRAIAALGRELSAPRR